MLVSLVNILQGFYKDSLYILPISPNHVIFNTIWIKTDVFVKIFHKIFKAKIGAARQKLRFL